MKHIYRKGDLVKVSVYRKNEGWFREEILEVVKVGDGYRDNVLWTTPPIMAHGTEAPIHEDNIELVKSLAQRRKEKIQTVLDDE